MSDVVLIDGDTAIFEPSFGEAMVIVLPGTLKASGPATVNGKKVCVAGDEKSVSVAGCQYMTPSNPILGTGDLEIASLAGDQTAGKTLSGGTPVMLVGSRFTATFRVTGPAQPPAPGGPVDPVGKQYSGSGSFKSANTKLKGV